MLGYPEKISLIAPWDRFRNEVVKKSRLCESGNANNKTKSFCKKRLSTNWRQNESLFYWLNLANYYSRSRSDRESDTGHIRRRPLNAKKKKKRFRSKCNDVCVVCCCSPQRNVRYALSASFLRKRTVHNFETKEKVL